MPIHFLADYPHFAEPLAGYHYAEWGAMLPWWTHAEALAELQAHTQSRTIPTTLVAVEDGELRGSASLVLEDLPEVELPGLASLSPWLASVFVLPAWRGQGVGRALVQAVEAHAGSLAITRLHLFTPEQAEFYRRLGWSVLQELPYRGHSITVMYK